MKLTKKVLQRGCLAVLGIYLLFAVLFLVIARDQIQNAGLDILMPLILLLVFVALAVYAWRMVYCFEHGKKCFGTLFVMTICRYQFLIEQLVSRDFKTKYKRSILGVFWSFLNPLLMMVVQYAVFSKLMRFSVENYIVYLLIGIVLFNGFSDCTNQSMRAIVNNATLITKVYVPKYIYPVTKVLSASINILLSMIPLLLVSLCTGLIPCTAWLMLPYGLLTFILFIIGMGFVLSSLMVFFRDIEFLWGVLTTAWMYATPIIYPISILPDFMQKLMILNPLYHYIDFFRTIIIGRQSPEPKAYLVCLGIAVLMCLCGSLIFRKTQDKFVLYI